MAPTKKVFKKYSLHFCSIFISYSIVWFQKISIPSPRRKLEIPEGWGVKSPGNSRGVGGGGGGVDSQMNFQMVQFDSVPTYSCSC